MAKNMTYEQRRLALRKKETRDYWDAQGLGERSDVDLAKIIGYSPVTVGMERRKRGIPRFRRYDIEWIRQPLGLEPDCDIAKRIGCSKSVVFTARTELGIITFKPPLVTSEAIRKLQEVFEMEDATGFVIKADARVMLHKLIKILRKENDAIISRNHPEES